MPSWNDVLSELEAKPTDSEKALWLRDQLRSSLQEVRRRRAGRNVLFYASAFLQKPYIPAPFQQITHEEINGFMSCLYDMDCDAGLTLILHTPGGLTDAAETVVAYLWSKFRDIEVVVPTYAMSAGTMIALSSNRIVMGKQSQLGPIDPQMLVDKGFVSARSIVDQFERAKADVLSNPALAEVWAPVLQTLGPAVLQEARNVLEYGGERMVAQWLEARMFAGDDDAKTKATTAARFFNDARTHKSHGRRIDREEARAQGVRIDDLEADLAFQDAVLTAYHIVMLGFERSAATKVLASHHRRPWVKDYDVNGSIPGLGGSPATET